VGKVIKNKKSPKREFPGKGTGRGWTEGSSRLRQANEPAPGRRLNKKRREEEREKTWGGFFRGLAAGGKRGVKGKEPSSLLAHALQEMGMLFVW